MSRTDKTRPGWVQEKDPLNNRFKLVGSIEWHYKPLYVRDCWCCTNRYHQFDEQTKRTKWREERQDLIKRWYADRWYKETLRDY